MATYFANQALPKVNAKGVGWSQVKKTAFGVYQVSDSGPMAANAQIYMCKVPKGAYITGGRVYGDPIDSSGSGSALASIHVGLDKAFTGIDGTAYTASTSTACLVSSLALGPDAVVSVTYKNTNQRNFPFGGVVLTNGPLLTSDDSNVVVTWTASALALTTGYLKVEVDYYVAQDS
jgi:hypothetical protein